MIFDELVAIGGAIHTTQLLNTCGARMLQDLPEHHVLNPSTKNAAAHQPCIDLPNFRLVGAADDDTDHSIVSESVGKTDLQCECGSILLNGRNFGIGVTASRQVVLVRFVNELNDACSSCCIKWLKRDRHIQRCEVSIHPAK